MHKALELLAGKKLAEQEGRLSFVNDELNRSFTAASFTTDHAIDAAWHHYTEVKPTPFDWDHEDFRKVRKWTYDAMAFCGGKFNPLNRTIIWPEKYFDFTIDKPWARYAYTVDGKKVEGQLALKGTMDLTVAVDGFPDTVELIDWKGLPLDTPIPTRDGWKTMESLSVGDVVFDECGNQTAVIGKSAVKERECYRIRFDDKTSVVADDEHRWKLLDGSVVSTSDLEVGNEMVVPGRLKIDDVDLPIDPYLLGVWLGDGRSRGGEITCPDEFIFQEIERRGHVVGPNIAGNDRCPGRTVYGLTTSLKKAGLNNDKHIPPQYLRASQCQRLALLRGLMDADGNANTTRKRAVFTSCNQRLSNDVKELLLSLGQRPNQSHITREMFGKTVHVFPIHFRPVGINPFLLPRKADRIDPGWGCGQSWKRRVVGIEPVGRRETQCIMVDSPSHTYLCTSNMLVTHNTGMRKDWATGKPKDWKKLRDDPQMRLYHYALSRVCPQAKHIIITIVYIQDGGPFSLDFHEGDLAVTERLIRERFEAIRDCERPRRIRHDAEHKWKCQRLCAFGMNNWEKTNKPVCDHVHDELIKLGIDRVTAKYGNLSAALEYGSGGGRSETTEKKA